MKSLVSTILCVAVLALSGCGTFIPKKVEFFQDEVEKFPEQSKVLKERQRQAAETAYQLANEGEVKELVRALSFSLGTPENVWPYSAGELSRSLMHHNAVYQSNIEKFKKDNNKNQGKKIEGTGLVRVPYFVWILIVLAVGFVGLLLLAFLWSALKMYSLSNPPLALGLNAAQLSAKGAGKMVTQLIKGGQLFKNRLKERFEPDKVDEIAALFRESHEIEQDEEAKKVIRHLKGK